MAEVSDLEAAASTGAEYLDQVESVLEEEDCEMCKSLLVSLRSRPLEEQVKGVNELSELKQAIVDDASPEEVDEMMDDFDVLDDPSEYI